MMVGTKLATTMMIIMAMPAEMAFRQQQRPHEPRSGVSVRTPGRSRHPPHPAAPSIIILMMMIIMVMMIMIRMMIMVMMVIGFAGASHS